MDEEVVINVDSVYKDFLLPHEKVNSIKGMVTGLTKGSPWKVKETQHALKNISFDVKKGEFFGIVGRNGSGKSTLLKILANIYQPTKGKVYTKGKLVPFIELGVGFNLELTGRDNVYLNGAMLGFSEKQVDAMYDDIVSFAELERFMDQKLKNYSSGMQVRLAFSMAIRSEADILLIDEVLAVGDADFQRKCYTYFKQLKKNKKTVVFVSHDMDAIREFCDRAALIEESKITYLGGTKEVASMYAELFLKDTPKSKSQNLKPSSNRSGSGWVVIDKAVPIKRIFTHKDRTISFKVTVKSNHKHTNLMTGFAVEDAAGNIINGTNTWEMQNDLPPLALGKSCEITWQLPNIYEDGVYSIDVYTYGDGNEEYDSLEQAISFQVKRPRRSGGLVAPEAEIKTTLL